MWAAPSICVLIPSRLSSYHEAYHLPSIYKPSARFLHVGEISQSNCKPCIIDGPYKRQDLAELEWSPQVNPPMPLEAIYSLMRE